MIFRLPNPTRKIVSVSKVLMIKSHRSLYYLVKLMWESYKATIRGNKIEWESDEPIILRTEKSVEVVVTIVDKQAFSIADGKKMADILSKLADTGSIKTIENQSEWQSQQRRERSLADRKK